MQEDKYKQLRQAVIDLSNRYVKNRDEFRQSLNLSDGLDNETVARVQSEVEKLKANKYLLAIVGESKSGKSAFINALLGKPILPTGVLQCTSGIIEIMDTDNDQHEKKVYLKVKYADQPKNAEAKKVELDENNTTALQEKLSEIAAIREEYRSLPIFQLNQYLIDQNHPQIKITYSLVEKLSENLRNEKEKKNNSHHLPYDVFDKQVAKKYLEEYKDLSKIPVEIYVGYPVGLKSAHIRIVDTPGVNARGGLQEATRQYIEKANAVIFIHLFKNIASESLQDFFNKSVPKQAYENIFLFLTHKAHATKEEVKRTLAETKILFPYIKEERVIMVDSMLKQIYDELAAGQTLDVLMENEEKRKLLADYVWRLKGDVNKIQPAVFKDSNFSTVQNLLTTFSEQALCGQLQWVVNQVADGYEQQRRDYDQHIGLLRQKTELTKTPEQFEREIDELKKLLDDYQRCLKDFSLNKQREYKGRYSAVNIKFSTMKEVYNRMLENARDEDEVRKYIMDFKAECEKEITSRTIQLRLEYQAEMERIGATFEKK